MNTDSFALLITDIDDRFVKEAKAQKPARALRWMAAAAAFILLAGVVFAAIKLAPEKAAVPKEAVLPPVQVGRLGEAQTSYTRAYDLDSAFEEAEAVCRVKIGDWLGSNGTGTYYEATVEKVYKGNASENITLYQIGDEDYTLEGSPLFTYGDELIVFLLRWEYDDGIEAPNCYELLGADLTYLYVCTDNDGNEYLFDNSSSMSYLTKQKCPGLDLSNYGDDAALADELSKNAGKYDPAIADRILHHAEFSVSDVLMQRYIYSLEEVEAFFASK